METAQVHSRFNLLSQPIEPVSTREYHFKIKILKWYWRVEQAQLVGLKIKEFVLISRFIQNHQ